MAIPTKKPNVPNNNSGSSDREKKSVNNESTSPQEPKKKPQTKAGKQSKANNLQEPQKRKPAKRDAYAERAVFVEDSSTQSVNEENDVEYAKLAKQNLSKDESKQKGAPDKFEEIDVSTIKTSIDNDAIDNPEYAKDPVTGKIYQKIPKTKFDANGMPMIQTDINDLDLQGAAEKFLAHLRVPPSKEEIAKMKQERIRKAEEARQAQKNRKNTQEELQRLYDEKN